MLGKLLNFFRKPQNEGDEDNYIVARSPHDGKKHVFHYEGQMTGFGKDEGHMWTSDDGYTYTTDALIEAQKGDKP